MESINGIVKLCKLSLTRKFTDLSDIANSYNRVSKNYENVFLKEMHKYNEEMLKEISKQYIHSNSDKELNILDLACGTGFNSRFLNNIFHKAKFTLVDISKGMLNEAKNNCKFNSVFIEKDMLSFLKSCEDDSFNMVVCAWAIKYQKPKEIIKEVARVLKKGGYFAVIVNLKSTLPEVRKIYPYLVLNNYMKVEKIMKELPNPKSEKQFEKWFLDNGFSIDKVKSGEHVFRLNSSEEVTKFVTSTGALAGFDSMVDMESNKVKDKMIDLFKHKNINTITHKYVWGVFENGK
ncbi:methyltransferase domain-containing protein [Clostridium sp. AL.422]|uniref:class I SAM-dependent methyltransferase n=1 Tax=Clostridium TaxID=1485 RepID=UPI00293DE019|nr:MULTISPECIES: methyltransferase domain-containing protein [unclassified Clostridium]MDV4151738.1 methyltransferase domain-containing protein [Clostridium sp. AL.422]